MADHIIRIQLRGWPEYLICLAEAKDKHTRSRINYEIAAHECRKKWLKRL
jgi:hypothetical protein